MKNTKTSMRFACSLAIFVIALSGCQQTPKSVGQPALTNLNVQIDPVRLRADLRDYLNDAYIRVMSTSGQIAANASDRLARESSLKLRIGISTQVESMLRVQDPRRQFLYTWIMAAIISCRFSSTLRFVASRCVW